MWLFKMYYLFGHYIPDFVHRLLLLNSSEKQSPLRGRSNTSRLPHLFWGNIIPISYFSTVTITNLLNRWNWHKFTKFGDYSICLNLWMMPLFCSVDIQYIRAAWRKWGNISSEYHGAHLTTSICSKSYCSICDDFCVWFCIRYACPLCLKSVCDMSKVWEKFDLEIAATPMPEQYQNKMVSVPFSTLIIIAIAYYSC